MHAYHALEHNGRTGPVQSGPDGTRRDATRRDRTEPDGTGRTGGPDRTGPDGRTDGQMALYLLLTLTLALASLRVLLTTELAPARSRSLRRADDLIDHARGQKNGQVHI